MNFSSTIDASILVIHIMAPHTSPATIVARVKGNNSIIHDIVINLKNSLMTLCIKSFR